MLSKIHFRPHPQAISVVLVWAATLLTQQLADALAQSQTLLFLLAVVMSSWYGGLKSGGLAAILSAVSIKFFFISPVYALSVADLNDGIRLAIFFLVALTGSLPGIQLERAKRRIHTLSERKFKESETRLRLALQAVRMGIWQVNLITGETIWTSETEQLFGLTPGTFEGRYETFLTFVHPDDRDALIQARQRAIQAGSEFRHDYRIIWPDGSIHWVESKGQVLCDDAGQPVRMLGTIIDIADRKMAEVALQERANQEEAFTCVLQAIRNSLDLNTIFATAAREFADLLQLDAVAISQYFPERGCWLPVAEHLRNPEFVPLVGIEIADEENPIAEQLRQRKVVVIQEMGTLQDPVNQEMARFRPGSLLTVPLEVDGLLWGTLGGTKSPSVRFAEEEISLARRFADQVSIAIQQANFYQQVQDLNRELEQRVEERTAALQESEEKFRQLAENVNHVFWMEDTAGSTLYTSPSYEEIWGHPVEALQHNPGDWLDAIHPDDRDRVIAQQSLPQKRSARAIEYRIIRPDGTIRWINDRSFPIHNSEGEIYRIAGLAEDITDRKQAELERQRQAEADQLLAMIAQTINQSVHLDQVLDSCLEQIRQFLQCDRVIVARFESDYRLVIEMEAVSRSELSLLGYMFHHSELCPEWFESVRLEEVVVRNDVQAEVLPAWHAKFLAQIQVRASVLVPILQVDKFWGLLIVNQCDRSHEWQPVEIELLKQLGVQIGTASQKASLYTQLESQLAQKEILLKEVHHRVKNNLQVISSMLWLQTKASNQSTLADALSDTRSRLQAMALIHETLYRSSNLGQLNFHNYIQCLANSILVAHSSSANQISLSYQLQPVTFNLDTAIPCGLLLNELLTNAIKHAFPHKQNGEIRITLEQASLPLSALNESQPDQQQSHLLPRYVLTIQDNGVGIPADLDLKRLKSLGLKIAYDLASQLRGSLELDRTNGTLFRLIFLALPDRNRV